MKSQLALLSILGALAACSDSEPQDPPRESPDALAINEPSSTEQSPSPDPDRVDRGRILFTVSPGNCVKCHGQDATGSDRAPNLTTGSFAHSDGSLDAIAQVITNGVPKDQLSSPSYPFEMSPRGSTDLTDDQCLDLAHYVRSLSE